MARKLLLVADVERVLRLSRDLRPRAVLITILVSAAIDGVALSQMLSAIVNDPQLTVAQCDRLLAIVRKHEERGLPMLATGMRGEYVWQRTSLRLFGDRIATEVDAQGRAVDRPLDRRKVAEIFLGMTGGVPGEGCPRVHDYAAHGHGPTETCTWHDRAGHLTYPDRAKGWLSRSRARHEVQDGKLAAERQR